MLIGELAEKTGLSRDTIRFYEKQGLIDAGNKRRKFNNYKEYSEELCERLLLIKRVKSFGFTLNETADILDMIMQQSASCGNISQKMTDKIALLEQKIRELEEIKKLMLAGIDKCETTCIPASETSNCSVLTEDLLQLKK
jgi:DNA-binding transcriptional MerR regulator